MAKVKVVERYYIVYEYEMPEGLIGKVIDGYLLAEDVGTLLSKSDYQFEEQEVLAVNDTYLDDMEWKD